METFGLVPVQFRPVFWVRRSLNRRVLTLKIFLLWRREFLFLECAQRRSLEVQGVPLHYVQHWLVCLFYCGKRERKISQPTGERIKNACGCVCSYSFRKVVSKVLLVCVWGGKKNPPHTHKNFCWLLGALNKEQDLEETKKKTTEKGKQNDDNAS